MGAGKEKRTKIRKKKKKTSQKTCHLTTRIEFRRVSSLFCVWSCSVAPFRRAFRQFLLLAEKLSPSTKPFTTDATTTSMVCLPFFVHIFRVCDAASASGLATGIAPWANSMVPICLRDGLLDAVGGVRFLAIPRLLVCFYFTHPGLFSALATRNNTAAPMPPRLLKR